MPSAFESKEVGEAKIWLENCGMRPRGMSLRRPKMLLGALLDRKSRDNLTRNVGPGDLRTRNGSRVACSVANIRTLTR